MKSFVAVLCLAAFACADYPSVDGNTAFGYLKKYGIPAAERIRKAEEDQLNSRIIGGVPAAPGQYEYQAGLITDIIGVMGRAVCGASLISSNRVLTAAHCWWDGQNQGWRITVVLGSITLFTGGTRLETSVIAVHPNWTPVLARNDIAVIYLPSPVSFSDTIGPIAMPRGNALSEDFAGWTAIASGFGLTADGGGISTSQYLSHVRLNVIANGICSIAFPLIVQSSNLCTSGIGGVGTCLGDSGGPLVTTWNSTRILIGVTSFGSALGCEANFPSAFARVTSFMPFIQEHL